MLDEICDHMDGFSAAEEAWLSSITETLRTWRYVMQVFDRLRSRASAPAGTVRKRFFFRHHRRTHAGTYEGAEGDKED